jgi:hypothetical protein
MILMNNKTLLNLEGKKVKFGHDHEIYLGNIDDTSKIIVKIKKDTEFIIKIDKGMHFVEPDGVITFIYDEQWITFDKSKLNGDTWEEGLSLLLIEVNN